MILRFGNTSDNIPAKVDYSAPSIGNFKTVNKNYLTENPTASRTDTNNARWSNYIVSNDLSDKPIFLPEQAFGKSSLLSELRRLEITNMILFAKGRSSGSNANRRVELYVQYTDQNGISVMQTLLLNCIIAMGPLIGHNRCAQLIDNVKPVIPLIQPVIQNDINRKVVKVRFRTSYNWGTSVAVNGCDEDPRFINTQIDNLYSITGRFINI